MRSFLLLGPLFRERWRLGNLFGWLGHGGLKSQHLVVVVFLLLLALHLASLLQGLLPVAVQTMEGDMDASHLLLVQAERGRVLDKVHHSRELTTQATLMVFRYRLNEWRNRDLIAVRLEERWSRLSFRHVTLVHKRVEPH